MYTKLMNIPLILAFAVTGVACDNTAPKDIERTVDTGSADASAGGDDAPSNDDTDSTEDVDQEPDTGTEEIDDTDSTEENEEESDTGTDEHEETDDSDPTEDVEEEPVHGSCEDVTSSDEPDPTEDTEEETEPESSDEGEEIGTDIGTEPDEDPEPDEEIDATEDSDPEPTEPDEDPEPDEEIDATEDSDPDPDPDPIEPVDADEDGYTAEDGDCDDANDRIFPGADDVCDGMDNDCDGVSDNDAAFQPRWYVDADGDGYGEGSSYVRACEGEAAAEGRSTVAGDCDDANDQRHPGADEICDGWDNDCDGEEPDGLALWIGSDGDTRDLTAEMSLGLEERISQTLDESGTLRLCKGVWNVELDIQGENVVIESVYGAEGTTLTAAALGAGVSGRVIYAGSSVDTLTLSGISITHGSSWEDGGLVYVANADVTVEDTYLFGGQADGRGGAMYVGGGSLTVLGSSFEESASGADGGAVWLNGDLASEDSNFQNNESAGSGGAVYVKGHDVELVDAFFYGNLAEQNGGGLAVEGSNVIDVRFTSSNFSANEAGQNGGAISVDHHWSESADEMHIVCDQAGVTLAGMFYNIARNGGALWVGHTASYLVASAECNWGTGIVDNEPTDIASPAWELDHGSGRFFTCTPSGCWGADSYTETDR